MLAQVGVDVELRKVRQQRLLRQVRERGRVRPHVLPQRRQHRPVAAVPRVPQRRRANYGKVGAPEIDKLLDQAGAETNRAKAVELLNQADVLLWKAGHSVPLFQTPQISAVRPGLANFGAFGLSSERQYVDVGWTS